MIKLLTLFSFLLSGFASQGQPSGPTKEQTAQFIKDYFSSVKFDGCLVKLEDNSFERYSYSIKKIEFDATTQVIFIDWAIYIYDTLEKTNILFEQSSTMPLNKVESIILVTEGPTGCDVIFLKFKATPSYKFNVIEKGFYESAPKITSNNMIEIPINVYSCTNCDDKVENKKIMQAFNHLRKLCGAPEPISFDEK